MTRSCRQSALLAVLGLVLSAVAQAQSPLRVETTAAEESALIREVPLTGSVTTSRIASLSSEVQGLVSNMHVDVGDEVEAGDLLLELDREMSQIALSSAEASAERTREALADSRRRLDEAERLAQKNNFPASEVRSLEAQVRMDQAELRSAEAEVAQQEAQLQRHRLRAPFDGTVSRKITEIGEWLTPGAEVVELVGNERLLLDFRVPQRFYPEVRRDTRLRVDFDAHPERSFNAVLHRKVPLSDNDGRTFLLRATLVDDDTPVLIPGMSADATLQLPLDRRGITVPRDALLRYPDGRVSVWVISDRNPQSGRANVREQQVETGLRFGDRIEIREGLEVGEQVVTRGNEALRAGQTVQIVGGERPD